MVLKTVSAVELVLMLVATTAPNHTSIGIFGNWAMTMCPFLSVNSLRNALTYYSSTLTPRQNAT